MIYYPFNISDYYGATKHLSPMEDVAYRRAIDHYFDKEMPLPKDPVKVARLLRLGEFLDDVVTVLDEFFELRDDGWHNERCDEELVRWYAKSAAASAAADKSVKVREAKRQRASDELLKAGNTEADTDGSAEVEPKLKQTVKPGEADVEPTFSGGEADYKTIRLKTIDIPSGIKDIVHPPNELHREAAINFVLSRLNELQSVVFMAAQHFEERLKRAGSLDELKQMADGAVLIARYKAAEWSGTMMAKYIRPQTLWNPKNWDDYLAVAKAWADAGKPALNGVVSRVATGKALADAAKVAARG